MGPFRPANLSRLDDFWEHVSEIDTVVAGLDDGQVSSTGIHETIRAGIEDAGAKEERLLDFAGALLALPEIRPRGESPVRDRFLDYYRELNKTPAAQQRATEDISSRFDEILMETLTAAWLGLYFLGIPFIHPWERVRSLIDQRSGIPSGACMAKFIGDIYRVARQQAGAGLSAEPVLVLSHMPVPLLRDVLTYEEQHNVTPPVVHRLARRYALLQLRLYVEARYPISLFVPPRALGAAIYKLASQETALRYADDQQNRGGPANLFEAGRVYTKLPDWEELPEPKVWALTRGARDKIEDGMWQWFRSVFKEPALDGQHVILLQDLEQTAAMPTCVLGKKSGVYTMETGNSGLHFAGNRLGEQLLDSYRDKLKALVPSNAPADRRVDGAVDLARFTADEKSKFKEAIRHAIRRQEIP